MKNEEEKYVSNNEYTAEFRRKTVKAALTAIGVTAVIAVILITLGLKTNFLYHTDFFKVEAEKTFPIHAVKKNFSGNEYDFELEEYINDNGDITVIVDVCSGEAALNRISPDNFKLICYENGGDRREEIISALDSKKTVTDDSSERKSCRYELKFARYPDEEDFSGDIYCLRIFTGSSDGTISILCNHNTKL
ncbi:MAG: hypothetical protein SOU50_05500 [Oscillospiraceae bacterium]|nr:hypothetical protein [Oscillospiraceae bacterium]MDD7429384.1 hypothetical protein [Oscillospiraceae bacterium]MDY2847655.1 hypothetical protein [Oscillospiraceae bacterium]